MRRIVTTLLSTITVLVLLFSYHTSTDDSGSPSVVAGSVAAGAPAPSPTASPTTSAGSSAAKAYTGDQVLTRWGPMQVEITVSGGRITAARAVQYPNGNGRDVEINGYALPVLSQEVVQRQSARIDTVSGATVTSDGYLQSLQSALDQAHL
jgi:uncharacterized protein with FMN-binding domain